MVSANARPLVDEALEILSALGVPVENETPRRRERIAMALLAAADVKVGSKWRDTSSYEGRDGWSLTTRQMIDYWNSNFGEDISSGSYDDVRRKDLVFLVEAGIVDKSVNQPDASTNNPTRGYGVNPAAASVVRTFGTARWEANAKKFVAEAGSLRKKMAKERDLAKVPVVLPDGTALSLSPGAHNDLQKAVIEDFLPRYAPGAHVLYVGDTSKKILIYDEARLKGLGFFELSHDTLPDVVAYDPKNNWLFLVEAVHSSNPVSKLRYINLERMTKDCKAPRIYVSAFADSRVFARWVVDISWETEVWLANSPDHMIHFNGDKFLGPYNEGSA